MNNFYPCKVLNKNIYFFKKYLEFEGWRLLGIVLEVNSGGGQLFWLDTEKALTVVMAEAKEERKGCYSSTIF